MPQNFHKTEGRLQHPNGTFSDYITIRFPAKLLHFTDINQSNPQVKLRDISHFSHFRAWVRGESDPLIVSFLQLEKDQPAAQLFPDIQRQTEAGESLTSANSLVTYTVRQLFQAGWVKYEHGNWLEQVPPTHHAEKKRAKAILKKLSTENRLHLGVGYGVERPAEVDFSKTRLNITQNLVPIANCGTLSDLVYTRTPRLAFNTTFFLLETHDYFSHHSGLGSGFNLWVGEGIIQRPPLYKRATLFGDADNRWDLGFFGLDDIEITLPSSLRIQPQPSLDTVSEHPFALNPASPKPVSVYTRYFGVSSHGQVLGKTPLAPNRLELTIIARQVGGWKIGGGLDIPQNGFIISFAEDTLSEQQRKDLLDALQENIAVDYQFAKDEYKNIVEAIQTGPLLVRNGIATIEDYDTEKEEEFWASRTLPNGKFQMGAVPTDYDSNVHNRHARVGLGIAEDGQMILVAVAGVSKGIGITDQESQGASLVELAHLLRDSGAIHAINLDGGGSAQVYYLGGRAIIPGERRGQPLVHYDRMVPSAGIVQ